MMNLATREGSEEQKRKESYFAARKIVEDNAEKELHYQRLITENKVLKEVLRLAEEDIKDWLYSHGESPESLKILEAIRTIF